jgi:hypothetical protein
MHLYGPIFSIFGCKGWEMFGVKMLFFFFFSQFHCFFFSYRGAGADKDSEAAEGPKPCVGEA